VEGIETDIARLSIECSAIELHRDYLVDPTGLKPAPNGLKVRRSITRAPGQEIADCRLLIFDWSFKDEESLPASNANWQSEIGNRQCVWLWRKDSNLRMAALTVRCLTSLATPQRNWLRKQQSNLPLLAYETSEPPLLYPRVMLNQSWRR